MQEGLRRRLRLKLSNSRAKNILDSKYGLLIFVAMPWPEEAFESVLFMTRHDVDVQVGYTLAHTVIYSYKGAIRL